MECRGRSRLGAGRGDNDEVIFRGVEFETLEESKRQVNDLELKIEI